MEEKLGRINIFTFTQEAAKAAMVFISSLPTNEDGDELTQVKLSCTLRARTEGS